jgi:hypothetical protein
MVPEPVTPDCAVCTGDYAKELSFASFFLLFNQGCSKSGNTFDSWQFHDGLKKVSGESWCSHHIHGPSVMYAMRCKALTWCMGVIHIAL